MTLALRRLQKILRCAIIFAFITIPLTDARANSGPPTNTDKTQAGLTVVLASVPANTPKNASIYIAGSFNAWQPGSPAYRLNRQAQGRYTIALPATMRGPIEFKFNLGTWRTVEQSANGATLPNRSFDIPATGEAVYSGTVQAWHLPPQSIAELKTELEKILSDTHTPGMSVAIVGKDGPEWAAGLGIANVADNRPATADTLFRIGSISKNFTALAILKLANQGKLSLQDPVRQLAPEVWFENHWEVSDPVRVVDLLEHTTGWDDMSLREHAKDVPDIGLREALDYDHHSRISRWRPGTRHSYCNSGTAVAAFIVEKIAGQRFEDYVQENFFAPIGMKTATYFQVPDDQAATLYHDDGKSPYSYWNMLYRPAGSINASANDMAAYLSFYLRRGEVNGASLMPAASIDRIETPTRSWAAQQGLSVGYGLYNTTSINDGFVFHGHAGGMTGAFSQFVYLPDYGVGFFYSINTANGNAFKKTGAAIHSYIVRNLAKPTLPVVPALPANAVDYSGWYEVATPRNQTFHFYRRLTGMTHLTVQDEQLHLQSPGEQDQPFVPVSANLFRSETDPIATGALLAPNSEGKFIVWDDNVWKRIPTWNAYSRFGLMAWFIFALVITMLYAPIWIVASAIKKWQRPQEIGIKIWPLVATLSFMAFAAILALSGNDNIVKLGRLSLWSGGIWLCTVTFALASVASAFALWKTRGGTIGRLAYGYAMVVVPALLIGTAYLMYWGVIGIRLWA